MGKGIKRTKEKIEVLGLSNITIYEQSATNIAIEDEQVDIITSNLGVNNFEEKEFVYSEIYRILRSGGKLCITTNPIGTFVELFDLFKVIIDEMSLKDAEVALSQYIAHRNNKESIVQEIEEIGFRLEKHKTDSTYMRFLDGEALLNHSLIRIGFRDSWERIIGAEHQNEFFSTLINRVNQVVASIGSFKMTIPMLYLEFKK